MIRAREIRRKGGDWTNPILISGRWIHHSSLRRHDINRRSQPAVCANYSQTTRPRPVHLRKHLRLILLSIPPGSAAPQNIADSPNRKMTTSTFKWHVEYFSLSRFHSNFLQFAEGWKARLNSFNVMLIKQQPSILTTLDNAKVHFYWN